ncbi:hypothetical protein LptCag_0358 [Leptospirillum ferriphilum]|uniref:Uncharacterized protein n=1 Tax=Leptospirillum ferriphilum TaxID=178606 RepID=A0A094WCC1_9BACT|nr:hypothetical protein LptCag_0358 [Leptospirillum ferriphilum]
MPSDISCDAGLWSFPFPMGRRPRGLSGLPIEGEASEAIGRGVDGDVLDAIPD